MSPRLRLALIATLVLAPLLWAAYRRVRGQEAAADLFEAVATAHQRVGYEGEGAWGNEWPGMWVVHDARSGRTMYGSGPWSHVESAPNGRMPDPAAFCLDLPALLENYRAVEGSPGRYLDRDVGTLQVEPLLEGRPRLEILFDRATLLPLRVKTIRWDGTPLREAVFHSIRTGDRKVQASCGPDGGAMGRSVPPGNADDAAGFPVWRPAYLPAGFRLTDCRVCDWMGPCARLLYTDGVTAFELWQQPVLSPARMESYFARAPRGPFGPEFQMSCYLQRGRRALARSGGAGPDGLAVERHECGAHVRYELRVAGSDVTLCARADLDPVEPLHVLRSLVVR